MNKKTKVKIAKNGPLVASHLIDIVKSTGSHECLNNESTALCQCGKSKSKPFCNGQHWYEKFRDEGLTKEVPVCNRSEKEVFDNKMDVIQQLAQTGI